MADIQNLLQQLLNAVYGKEVRQSIHDAIKQCYDDGKAGSVDLQAREDILVERARIDNIIKLGTLGYVMPEMFGAVGDGVTDDTEAFQKMIDSKDGLLCVLSAKTYLINGTLKFYNKSAIRLVGTSQASSGTYIKSTKKSGNMIEIDGSTQITFEYIFFGNFEPDTDSTLTGINCGVFDSSLSDHRVNSLRVLRCYFRGLYKGIVINAGTGYMYLYENAFQHFVNHGSHIEIGKEYDNSYYTVSPNYVYIYNNAFNCDENNLVDHAIAMYSGYWLEIWRNDFANFRGETYPIYGTNITGRLSEIHIKDNAFFSSNYGIKFEPSANSEFSNFQIDGNNFLCLNNGIYIDIESNDYRTVRTVNITNNTFSDTGSNYTLCYIKLVGVDGYYVEGNYSYQKRLIIDVLASLYTHFENCSNGNKKEIEIRVSNPVFDSSGLLSIPITNTYWYDGVYVKRGEISRIIHDDTPRLVTCIVLNASSSDKCVRVRAYDETGVVYGNITIPLLTVGYKVENNV